MSEPKRKLRPCTYAALTREAAARHVPAELLKDCPGHPCADCGREVIPQKDSLARALADAPVIERGLDILCMACAATRTAAELAAGFTPVVCPLPMPEELRQAAAAMGFGPTGKHPDGRLADDDEGELMLGITTDGDKVVIAFGAKVEWLAMQPDAAREMAQSLLRHADEAEAASKGGTRHAPRTT